MTYTEDALAELRELRDQGKLGPAAVPFEILDQALCAGGPMPRAWQATDQDREDYAALHCASCGAHVADPHAPGCPNDPDNGPDEDEANPCDVPEVA